MTVRYKRNMTTACFVNRRHIHISAQFNSTVPTGRLAARARPMGCGGGGGGGGADVEDFLAQNPAPN